MGSTPPEVIWSSDVAQRPASLSAPAPHCGCVQSSSTLTPHLVSNFPPWSRESKSYIQRWGFQGGQNSSAAVLSWSLLQLVRTPLANTCSLNNESGFFFFIYILTLWFQTTALSFKLPNALRRRGCTHPDYICVTSGPSLPGWCFQPLLMESTTFILSWVSHSLCSTFPFYFLFSGISRIWESSLGIFHLTSII